MMKRMTKKDLAVGMFERGLRIETIADLLQSDPSYIANALIERGHTPAYADLYTSVGPQNHYAAMLSGVLRFKDVAAAKKSVARINELFEEFAAARDRRGMHQCQVLALTGLNRAEGLGKREEAKLFADWLAQHLLGPRTLAETIQLMFPEDRETEAVEEAELPLMKLAA